MVPDALFWTYHHVCAKATRILWWCEAEIVRQVILAPGEMPLLGNIGLTGESGSHQLCWNFINTHHSLRHFLPNLSSLYLLYGSYLHHSLTTLLIFFSQLFSLIRLLHYVNNVNIKSCLSFISQRTQASTSGDRSNLKEISGKPGSWVWLTFHTTGKENNMWGMNKPWNITFNC